MEVLLAVREHTLSYESIVSDVRPYDGRKPRDLEFCSFERLSVRLWHEEFVKMNSTVRVLGRWSRECNEVGIIVILASANYYRHVLRTS